VPKGKKIKVLMHRPRYIETTIVPNINEGASSTVEAKQAPPAVRSVEESATVPKVSATESAEVTIQTVETEEETAEKLDREEKTGPPEAELPKVAKTPTITPKRRRMASVLDAVMETTRALTPTPVKKVAEAVMTRVETEAGPSAPTEAEPTTTEQKDEREFLDISTALEKDVTEKAKSPIPEASSEDIDFIIQHALEKSYLKKKLQKPNTMPGN
jgi:hypothetical protein